ncbi:hypothetical protein AA313_de0201798 [Arthrobotrys entomopaga]|nr:hypothetical protein AA313_de0201798 [Arthrobotrys entomopaga]
MAGKKNDEAFYTYVERERPKGVPVAFYMWIALAKPGKKMGPVSRKGSQKKGQPEGRNAGQQGKGDKEEGKKADKNELEQGYKDNSWYQDSRYDGYWDDYGFDGSWQKPAPRIPNPYVPASKDTISFVEDAINAKDREAWLNDKVGLLP